jgi:hypothetical protein
VKANQALLGLAQEAVRVAIPQVLLGGEGELGEIFQALDPGDVQPAPLEAFFVDSSPGDRLQRLLKSLELYGLDLGF